MSNKSQTLNQDSAILRFFSYTSTDLGVLLITCANLLMHVALHWLLVSMAAHEVQQVQRLHPPDSGAVQQTTVTAEVANSEQHQISHTLILALCIFNGVCVESLILHAHFAQHYSKQLAESDEGLRSSFKIYDSIYHTTLVSGMPGVKTKLQNLLSDLESLASGRLKISARWAAYQTDCEFVERLQAGDELLATVPTNTQDFVEQFQNHGFIELEKAFIRARLRGVHVRRLYYVRAVPEWESISQLPEKDRGQPTALLTHLQRMVEHGIEVRLIKSNEGPFSVLPDIMVFGSIASSRGEADFHEWSRFDVTYEQSSEKVEGTRTDFGFFWNSSSTKVFVCTQKADRKMIFQKKRDLMKRLSQLATGDRSYRSLVGMNNPINNFENEMAVYKGELAELSRATSKKPKRLYVGSEEAQNGYLDHLKKMAEVAEVKILLNGNSDSTEVFCFGDLALLKVDQEADQDLRLELFSDSSQIAAFRAEWDSAALWEHRNAKKL